MINGNPKENGKTYTHHFEDEPQVDVQNLRNRPFPIVGIGGSAGAFDSFKAFFKTIPPDSGIAFVLVQHLDPSVKSMLPELLQRSSSMEVIQVEDGMVVEPNRIYVIPENTEMVIFNGKLLLFKPARPRGLRMPIDTFFQSLAADWGEKAVAIIFSGMGSDGELGTRFIKKALGLIIAQEPSTAPFDSMPRSVIDSELADYVEAPADMAEKLFHFIKQPFQNMQKKNAFASPKVSNTLNKVLQVLRTYSGHDFSLYKNSTLFRRLERRIHTHQLTNMEEYVQYLQDSPEEVQVLFRELLIGVTKFFRDYQAFQLLEDKILPDLLKNKSKNQPFRVWIAGCSTGEEAYSIAILIREYWEKSRAKIIPKVQIYATDLSKESIERARKGLYYSNMAADMSPERLERYFTKQGNMYQVSQEIREMVVFAEHNLMKDPAFTKLDLLCCRNVFIYFKPELQKKLLPVFHFTLNAGGVLLLGPSENIHGFEDLFEPVDLKWKFYRRRENAPVLAGLIDFPGKTIAYVPSQIAPVEEKPKIIPGDAVKKVLLGEFTPPSVLINEKGDILFINGRTGRYMELMSGNAELNIFSMARERLSFELHSAVRQARATQQEIVVNNLKLQTDQGRVLLKLTVKYLKTPEEIKGLLLVVFQELPVPKKSRKKAGAISAASLQGMEEMETENKLLREQLQQTREEKDVTVEEIKSANEELQSTNEELQSTNEEAISAKEELQSMNEELMTVNTELREKSDQLTEIHNDMANLLNSSEIATIFLDTKLRIKRFTPAATKIMNLIPSDIGRPLSHIRFNMQYETLLDDVRSVIDRLVPKELEVRSGEDKYFSIRILPYRTKDNFIDGAVLTFIDITSLKELQKTQQEKFAFLDNIINSMRDPIVILDVQLRVVTMNRSFIDTFHTDDSHTRGQFFHELGSGQWNNAKLRQLLNEISLEKNGQASFDNYIIEHHFPAIGARQMKLHARRLVDKDGKKQDHLILLTMEDISGQAEK